MKKGLQLLLMEFFILVFVLPGMSRAEGDPLAQWAPAFDPSQAQYTYLLSCVGHPAIEGVMAGFRIRDRLWVESGGRIYVDFRPLSILGGEKDVINKLKFGAVQGMMSSSVAAANIAPKLGIVNIPFLVDSFEKLEQFIDTPELWQPFATAPMASGLEVLDVTGYGSYGWATTSAVTTMADARKINFRIAQAPVNIDVYKAWGLKFTVLPWPDVPQALQTGVINGLDHTPIVCNISKKFGVAKNYTELDYAQGLYIHIVSTKWLKKLPEDLQEIFRRVVKEESERARNLTLKQQEKEIAAAKAAGVTFYRMEAAEKAQMKQLLDNVYEKWADKIGKAYFDEVKKNLQ